jgi:hypothetical protein
MNERTAKLISRFASRTNQKPSQVKREWKSLTAKERAQRRAEMKAAVK